MIAAELAVRADRLETALLEMGSVLVAFSGGADSALVLAAAVRVLGPERVAAATGISGSLPERERVAAQDFARSFGVRWFQPTTDELAREGYRRNAGDRCYFCKAELLAVLGPLAAEHGLRTVVTGTNADDMVAGFRPGIRAAREAGARAPLADAGLTKSDVRALSAAWGLPTWDKPAAACLSSRIAYGIAITPARLSRVEAAEAGVRAVLAGSGVVVVDLRVRDLGDAAARVELDGDAVDTTARSGAAEAVIGEVRRHGFETVDIGLFRSGALNAMLSDPAAYR